MKRIYLIFILFAMTMVSCVPEAEKATVEIKEFTDVTLNSARVVCNVSDDGGAEVSSRGVCWDILGNPTIETASSMVAGSGIGNYECEVDGLESGTTYYVRAYATNSAGISYGEQKEFMTLGGDGGNEDSDEIAGHEFVDLGLPSGKKWATCNVGASSPEDYGDYFAWGETNPKAEYDWDTYLHWNDLDGDGGYDDGETTINSDISGNAQYDAAAANWGGSWRMPTKDEMQELVDYCEWEWTQVNGVNGSKVTGPNGSCIFLPAAGYRYGTSLYDDGYYGGSWSSTLYGGYDDYAYDLYFGDGGEYVHYGYRYDGLPVRPITE